MFTRKSRLSCEFCGKRSSSEINLRVHKRAEHLLEGQLCPYCVAILPARCLAQHVTECREISSEKASSLLYCGQLGLHDNVLEKQRNRIEKVDFIVVDDSLLARSIPDFPQSTGQNFTDSRALSDDDNADVLCGTVDVSDDETTPPTETSPVSEIENMGTRSQSWRNSCLSNVSRTALRKMLNTKSKVQSNQLRPKNSTKNVKVKECVPKTGKKRPGKKLRQKKLPKRARLVHYIEEEEEEEKKVDVEKSVTVDLSVSDSEPKDESETRDIEFLKNCELRKKQSGNVKQIEKRDVDRDVDLDADGKDEKSVTKFKRKKQSEIVTQIEKGGVDWNVDLDVIANQEEKSDRRSKRQQKLKAMKKIKALSNVPLSSGNSHVSTLSDAESLTSDPSFDVNKVISSEDELSPLSENAPPDSDDSDLDDVNGIEPWLIQSEISCPRDVDKNANCSLYLAAPFTSLFLCFMIDPDGNEVAPSLPDSSYLPVVRFESYDVESLENSSVCECCGLVLRKTVKTAHQTTLHASCIITCEFCCETMPYILLPVHSWLLCTAQDLERNVFTCPLCSDPTFTTAFSFHYFRHVITVHSEAVNASADRISCSSCNGSFHEVFLKGHEWLCRMASSMNKSLASLSCYHVSRDTAVSLSRSREKLPKSPQKEFARFERNVLSKFENTRSGNVRRNAGLLKSLQKSITDVMDLTFEMKKHQHVRNVEIKNTDANDCSAKQPCDDTNLDRSAKESVDVIDISAEPSPKKKKRSRDPFFSIFLDNIFEPSSPPSSPLPDDQAEGGSGNLSILEPENDLNQVSYANLAHAGDNRSQDTSSDACVIEKDQNKQNGDSNVSAIVNGQINHDLHADASTVENDIAKQDTFTDDSIIEKNLLSLDEYSNVREAENGATNQDALIDDSKIQKDEIRQDKCTNVLNTANQNLCTKTAAAEVDGSNQDVDGDVLDLKKDLINRETCSGSLNAKKELNCLKSSQVSQLMEEHSEKVVTDVSIKPLNVEDVEILSDVEVCLGEFICEFCGKDFNDIPQLDTHHRKHRKVGVRCPLCLKFVPKKMLLCHRRVFCKTLHNEVIWCLRCKLCDSTMLTPFHLLRHAIDLHRDNVTMKHRAKPPPNEPVRLRCDHCAAPVRPIFFDCHQEMCFRKLQYEMKSRPRKTIDSCDTLSDAPSADATPTGVIPFGPRVDDPDDDDEISAACVEVDELREELKTPEFSETNDGDHGIFANSPHKVSSSSKELESVQTSMDIEMLVDNVLIGNPKNAHESDSPPFCSTSLKQNPNNKTDEPFLDSVSCNIEEEKESNLDVTASDEALLKDISEVLEAVLREDDHQT